MHLAHRSLRIDYPPVRSKQKFILAERICKMYGRRAPMFRRIGVTAHEDIPVFCRDTDHLLGPGIAEMYADNRQLRKVYRDPIERDWACHRREAAVRAIDQTMANLHHDRNPELGTARVIGVINGRVGRLAEPM